MCLYPRIIKNRKYTANKKNGGNIPAVNDQRTELVPVGCGNCIECRKQKARAWQVRLLEDLKEYNTGKFITLTFSNESIRKINTEGSIIINRDDTRRRKEIPISELEGYEKDNAIAKWAVRHFLERYRKEHQKSLRHWFITELGHNGTENIHLHGIIWLDNEKEWKKELVKIEKIWNYGFMWKWKIERGRETNYVNEGTVNYIIKYVTKVDLIHQKYKPIILSSAGIGRKYLESIDVKKNKYNGEQTIETYRNRQGYKMNLPVYYRNAIYTEEEREKLWIQKLDKQERYVCGERIDISKGDTQYWEAIKWHRVINKRLGYGNNEKDWNREQYEMHIRRLKHNVRLGIQSASPAGQ